MIDADPQGSLTASLGYMEPDELKTTLATIMMAIINEEEIQPTDGILHHKEGVDLLPGNIELSALEVIMGNVMSRELIMKEYVEQVRKRYDYILIDCMPSLGMITINALVSADFCINSGSGCLSPGQGPSATDKNDFNGKETVKSKASDSGNSFNYGRFSDKLCQRYCN